MRTRWSVRPRFGERFLCVALLESYDIFAARGFLISRGNFRNCETNDRALTMVARPPAGRDWSCPEPFVPARLGEYRERRRSACFLNIVRERAWELNTAKLRFVSRFVDGAPSCMQG